MQKKNTMITDWLDQNGDPEIEKFVAKNLAIVEQVHQALDDRGWSQTDLANAMGKRTSEVSKWLSGMHNLTLKSIVKMEMALGIDIVHTEPKKEFEYVFSDFGTHEEDLAKKSVEYDTSYYALAV